MRTIAELKAAVRGPGRLEWIGLSPARRSSMLIVPEATVAIGTGLEGDHHARSGQSKRQVTLIQHEHLPVVAALAGIEVARPEMLRRNLVISGINLLMFKDRKFRIGEAWFEGTGLCAPCSRMEETLGPGGYQAMRGHGGLTARVLRQGRIRLLDQVLPLDDEEAGT